MEGVDMKSIIEFIAGAWLGFSLIAGLYIWHCYDGHTDEGMFFVDGDSIYWVGYLGELDYE